jgi:flavin-dependent dehydrogenase
LARNDGIWLALPLPGSAELTDQAGYGSAIPASERVQATVVLLADGSRRRLRRALDLAADWRDLLTATGLADEDRP